MRAYLTTRATPVTVILLAFVVAWIPRQASAASGPSLPSGFYATIFAQGLTYPTAMSTGPDGRLYVAQENGTITAVSHRTLSVIASGFTIPLGLTWYKRTLYVSWTGHVSVLTPSAKFRSWTRKTIISGLPTGKHQNDGMVVLGGWLYVGIGSTCNACTETDGRSATIMRFHLNGGNGQIYARGLRNPYDLAVQPRTGRLFATDNGRDDYGNSVPDELNVIVRGGRYGWPNCWGVGGGSGCTGTVAPVALFEPHASADGLAFYTGSTFPSAYRGDAFVAEFGRTVGVGYEGHRVKRVHFSGGRAVVSDFATGLTNPLAVTMARDGSLLVADFGTGIIWRVQANGH